MLEQDKIEQARQNVARGFEIKQIALSLDVSEDTVTRYTKDIKRARKQAFGEAVKILSQSQLFLSHQAIAKILGISRPVVSRIAQTLNLPNSLDYFMPKGISKEVAQKQVEMLENLRKQAISKALELLKPTSILSRCQNSSPEITRKPPRDWNGINQDLAWKDREIEAEKDNAAHLELLLVSERQENEEINEKLEDATRENETLAMRSNQLEMQNQELLQKIRELESRLQESERTNKELSERLDYAEKKLHEIVQRANEQERALQERQTMPGWAMGQPILWQSLKLVSLAFGQRGLVRKLNELGVKVSRAIVRTWLGVIHPKPVYPKDKTAAAIMILGRSFCPPA